LKNLQLRGLQMHIGSQITEIAPFERPCAKCCRSLKTESKAWNWIFSIGGGLGIIYQSALASGQPSWWKWTRGKRRFDSRPDMPRGLCRCPTAGFANLIEPGRFISGQRGILVTRVEFVKETGRKNLSSWTRQ